MTLQIFSSGSKASEEQAAEMVEQQMDPALSGSQNADPLTDLPQGGIPDAPVLSHPNGAYQGEIMVSLVDPGKGVRYFYTLDGTEPTEESERYLGPVPLSGDGEITFRVAAFSADGKRGGEASAVYSLEPAGPSDPVILEDSGEYTQSTMIVVVSQENCRITYTTDGSDPEEDSTEYTAPIKMPVGSSIFRFRSFDAEGNASEIVERSYHLVYARLISEEQAVSSIVRILVDQNVLIDETGKVLGKEGNNSYLVESIIEIEGAGEYYRIVERYNHPDGTYEDTGLLYAVNTNDGSVHRLGYDSSGNYTLFTLSGR
jgi:YD repeat-containing protein